MATTNIDECGYKHGISFAINGDPEGLVIKLETIKDSSDDTILNFLRQRNFLAEFSMGYAKAVEVGLGESRQSDTLPEPCIPCDLREKCYWKRPDGEYIKNRVR